MARKSVYSVAHAEIDGTPFLALQRSLVDDAGNITRAKGGVWIDLSAADAAERLAHACEQALAFAAACEAEFNRLMAPKPVAAPKPARKPTQAPPAAPAPIARLAPPAAPTITAARDANQSAVARTQARQAAVTQARASKPAVVRNPAPVQAPKPAQELSWFADLMAQAGAI